MGTNRSQKLDIADICDDVNAIGSDVSDILAAATDETLGNGEITALIVAQETLSALQEIVLHLRMITNEDFSDDC